MSGVCSNNAGSDSFSVKKEDSNLSNAFPEQVLAANDNNDQL